MSPKASDVRPCSKCAQTPRLAGQSWCRACLSEYQRAKRAAARVTRPPVTQAAAAAVTQGLGLPFDLSKPNPAFEALKRKPAKAKGCADCARLQKRLAVLETDNAALKRELARRPYGLTLGTSPGPPPPHKPRKAPPPEQESQAPHGTHCSCIRCRVERAQ